MKSRKERRGGMLALALSGVVRLFSTDCKRGEGADWPVTMEAPLGTGVPGGCWAKGSCRDPGLPGVCWLEGVGGSCWPKETICPKTRKVTRTDFIACR